MRRASLSPEARLLFLAAAVTPSDSALRQTVSGGIDWDDLCALAEHETATSVVLRQLHRIRGSDGTSLGELRQSAMLSAMRMLNLEQLLRQTVSLLAHENIETVLLKGAGLGYTAYSSFSERPMNDLDIMVRPSKAERAWSLLRTRDWSPSEATLESGMPSGHHHHLPRLFQEGGAYQLEIHDQLLPVEHPFRFSADIVWDRVEYVTANGVQFVVPHPMHQLWHTCVHFAWSHGMEWGSWRSVRDVAAIIHTRRIDWPEFIAFARDTRAATCCYWTLRLARRLAGASVPDVALESLRPPYPEVIVNRLESHLLASLFPSDSRCPSVRLTRRLWELAILPGWSGHGPSRPWLVSERWLARPENVSMDSSQSATLGERLRRIGAGGAYLFRVTRLALPMDLADPGAA